MTDPASTDGTTPRVDRRLVSPDAFWALVEPHDANLRRLAYRLLGDPDVMDDVLQDSYIKAFRATSTFRGDAGVGTWLYRIVYNACMDELRRSRRRRDMQLHLGATPPPPAPDPADVAVRRRDLAAALASLPADMRAAVLMVDADGLDYQGAAEVLGVSVGTLASRLSRARGRLRAVMDDPRGQENP